MALQMLPSPAMTGRRLLLIKSFCLPSVLSSEIFQKLCHTYPFVYLRGYIPECNCGPNEKLTNKGNFVNQDLFKKMFAEKPTREDIRETSNEGWKDNVSQKISTIQHLGRKTSNIQPQNMGANKEVSHYR